MEDLEDSGKIIVQGGDDDMESGNSKLKKGE